MSHRKHIDKIRKGPDLNYVNHICYEGRCFPHGLGVFGARLDHFFGKLRIFSLTAENKKSRDLQMDTNGWRKATHVP